MRRCFLKPVAKQNAVYRKQHYRGYRCVFSGTMHCPMYYTWMFLHVRTCAGVLCIIVTGNMCASVTVRDFLEVYKLREDTLSR